MTQCSLFLRKVRLPLIDYIVIVVAPYGKAVLPSHVSTSGPLDKNSLVVRYFHPGFDYDEILGFLLLCHGIQISLLQLKRILRSNGLFRRRSYGSPNCGLLGYHQMHQRLRCYYGLSVNRKSVRIIMKTLDAYGVARRSRRRLRRRQNRSKVPLQRTQFIWHTKLIFFLDFVIMEQ